MITDWMYSLTLLEIHYYFQKVFRQKDGCISQERQGDHNKCVISAYKPTIRRSPIALPKCKWAREYGGAGGVSATIKSGCCREQAVGARASEIHLSFDLIHSYIPMRPREVVYIHTFT